MTAADAGLRADQCGGCAGRRRLRDLQRLRLPLIAEDASQACPSCGRRTRTAALGEQARSLTATAAHFDTEQAAAEAALAESAGFRAWMLALAAQTQ